MPKLPVLKPREVVALLAKLGFAEVRQRGSHRQFRHADIGVLVEDLLAGQPAQQPNTAPQPSAGESPTTRKPPEPGRG